MNIIITGASRGIGYSIVKVLTEKLNQGSIIVLSRNKTKLNELKIECEKINHNCKITPVAFDFLKPNDIKNTVKLIDKQFNKIDIIINNAGFLIRQPFSEFDENSIFNIFNVNFFGPAKLIKELIPLMESKSHVVNIGSMAGYQGSSKFPGLNYYSASKAAIAILTECLAVEYKDSGISFNCLAIGSVQTEMFAEAFPGYHAPLNANEMAEFIADFALNGNKYFNGKVLPVALSTP